MLRPPGTRPCLPGTCPSGELCRHHIVVRRLDTGDKASFGPSWSWGSVTGRQLSPPRHVWSQVSQVTGADSQSQVCPLRPPPRTLGPLSQQICLMEREPPAHVQPCSLLGPPLLGPRRLQRPEAWAKLRRTHRVPLAAALTVGVNVPQDKDTGPGGRAPAASLRGTSVQRADSGGFSQVTSP